MKHKVAELEGALLDAAVAKAEGVTLVWANFERLDYSAIDELDGRQYRPSVLWNLGGPIIDREAIAFRKCSGYAIACTNPGADSDTFVPNRASYAIGPSLLIAAMRSYVTSKFGNEIELP